MHRIAMRRIATWVAGGLLVLTSIACGLGDTDTGSSTSSGDGTAANATAGTDAAKNQPVTVKVGEPLTLTETILGSKTVAVITLTNLKTKVKSGNQFVTPSKGQFITADVTVEVREGKYSISSGQFKLVGADGTAFDSTTLLDSKDLSGTDLTTGQKTSGQIVFDAAVGVEKGGKIAVKSWLADGDAGYWTTG